MGSLALLVIGLLAAPAALAHADPSAAHAAAHAALAHAGAPAALWQSAAAAALGHSADAAGTGPGWGELLRHWSFDPLVLSLLLLSAALYVRGVLRLWRQAGAGRGITVRHAALFAGGWLALVAALVSPLDVLGAYLFSAHMVQHEVLMLVAAPLLVLGQPLAAWAWAFRVRQARALGMALRARWWAACWSVLKDPLCAWGLHAVALWGWHVPALFEAALHNEAVHILQHVSFLGTALLFWWAVLGTDARVRHRSGWAMLSLFTTMLHTGALGALLTFAATPWYPDYAATAGALGLDPVEDQQLGGLVMWVPGGAAYLVAGLAVIARLLQEGHRAPAMPAHPGLPRSGAR